MASKTKKQSKKREKAPTKCGYPMDQKKLQKQERLFEFVGHITSLHDADTYLKHAQDPDDVKLLKAAAEVEFDPTAMTASQRNGLEAIVVHHGRPVLLVRNGEVEPTEDRLWKRRISDATAQVERNIVSVCRIEVRGHPLNDFTVPGEEVFLGTGSVVGPNLILTNRHVALEFCEQDGSLKFGMSANIDFVEEHGRDPDKHYAIKRLVEFGRDYDYALLEVESQTALPQPIKLASGPVGIEQSPLVYIVGYPAFDTRNPTDIQNSLFKGLYDVKRFAPGRIRGMTPSGPNPSTSEANALIWSDYLSLGGNSGSPVFSFSTGECVALHFSGRYGEANYSIPIWAIADRIRAANERAVMNNTQSLDFTSISNGDSTMYTDFTTKLLSDRANYMPLGVAKKIASNGFNPRSATNVFDAAAAAIVLGHFGCSNEKINICSRLNAVTPALANACALVTNPEKPGIYSSTGPYNPNPPAGGVECVSFPGGEPGGYDPQPWNNQPWHNQPFAMEPWGMAGLEGVDATCIAGAVGGAIAGGASAGPAGAIGGALLGAAGNGCFD